MLHINLMASPKTKLHIKQNVISLIVNGDDERENL